MLQVELEGPGDGLLHVSDPLGAILEIDDDYTGVEHGSVELAMDGVHFLQVEMASGDSSWFELSSSVRLKPFDDPDDGRTIGVGETIAGSLDFYADLDWYSIGLKEDETVRISTDSLNVDTVIFVDFPKSRNNQVVFNDDSGGGLSGTNSELVYRAPHTGEYFIAVREAQGISFGGYYLSVEPARKGTETASVPPSPQTVESPYGKMVVFEGQSGSYLVEVPEAWTETAFDASTSLVFSARDPVKGGLVEIREADVSNFGTGELALEHFADAFEDAMMEKGDLDWIERESGTTSQGLTAVLFLGAYAKRDFGIAIYLIDDRIAVVLSYEFPSPASGEQGDLAAYSIGSLMVR